MNASSAGHRCGPERQYFSYADGGVVSRAAAEGIVWRLTELDVDTLKLLRHLQRNADYAAVANLALSQSQHLELERVMLGYITYLLESRLGSVDFIRRLRQGESESSR